MSDTVHLTLYYRANSFVVYFVYVLYMFSYFYTASVASNKRYCV